MRLGATLNGFTIVTPPTNNDAGMSQWCHVERDGERFFMKMYLSPKYPTASAPGTAEGKERRRVDCEAFERRHLTIANRLKGDAPGGGHLVTTLAFFRVGPAYYKVTRLVDIDHRVNLIDQDSEIRAIALRSLLFSVRLMHDQGIVHGDLKPDNVLFQRTAAGAVTSKLIDFDEAYISGEPPAAMHIVGDPLYYAPEMFRYVKQIGHCGPADLTLASDIFSLGVLIHVMLTGELPYFDTDRFGYPCESVAASEPLVLRETIPVGSVRQMLTGMLETHRFDRPDINTVIAAFRANDLRVAAEGAAPKLTRAEEVAMRRLHDLAFAGASHGGPRSPRMIPPAPSIEGLARGEPADMGDDVTGDGAAPRRATAASVLWTTPPGAGGVLAATDDDSAPPVASGDEASHDGGDTGRLRSTFGKPTGPDPETKST